tara:strand:- start:72 stop:278 length:207 start_codon:yes stop_codon:yes gene_type:complete
MIHTNTLINQTALETVMSLSMGVTTEDMLAILDTYEEAEMYEYCAGIMLGIKEFSTNIFNCRIGNITE